MKMNVRKCKPTYQRRAMPGWAIGIVTMFALAGCATPSLDMSGGRIDPPGPDGGIVIGSVLVQAEKDPPNSWFNRLFGRKAAGFTYDFEIVSVNPKDPQGERSYEHRYELDAKPGEERIFAARLPTGSYLIKTFRHEGLSAMGGNLGVVFSVAPDATWYIGRLLLEVPRRVTMGTAFTYKVEDAREATLAAVQKQHPDLRRHAVSVPMQVR
jgi:hypothetical protein